MSRAQHDKCRHPAAFRIHLVIIASSGDTFCLLRSIRQNADITIQKEADIDNMVDYASVAQGIMDLSCADPRGPPWPLVRCFLSRLPLIITDSV